MATVQQPCYGNRFRLVAMQPSSPCGRAVGGSQYRDDQFPRKTGEIDSARSHMNVSAIFPFTSAIIRRASHTPSPPQPPPPDPDARPLFSSIRSPSSCASITHGASIWKKFPRFFLSLPRARVMENDFSSYFSFFSSRSFSPGVDDICGYVLERFDGRKIGVEKKYRRLAR